MTDRPHAAAPIRVLICDDSAIVRQILQRELSKDPQILVVGVAQDPFVARDKILELNPDVLTLDVEMPKMDGISFLKRLQQHHPMPVIVVSSLTVQGTQTAIDAMAAGAFDVLAKPGSSFSVESLIPQLIQKIKKAAPRRPAPGIAPGTSSGAGSGDGSLAAPKPPLPTPKPLPLARPVVAPLKASAPRPGAAVQRIIVIGASTGGVQALTEVLSAFPPDAPATLVVQHMPPKFTASFAERLNSLSAMEVKEAADGDQLAPGRVLVAPGGFHMVLRGSGTQYFVDVKDGPEVHHQRPSVEVLFQSVARIAGRITVGAILTGMGADGATGLLALRQAGAKTLAQDEKSSVVFGMPMEAIKCGGAEHVVSLKDIARTLIQLAQR